MFHPRTRLKEQYCWNIKKRNNFKAKPSSKEFGLKEKKWNVVKYFGLARVPVCLTQPCSLKLVAPMFLGHFPSAQPPLWQQLLDNSIPSPKGQGHPRAQQTPTIPSPPSASALPGQSVVPQPGSRVPPPPSSSHTTRNEQKAIPSLTGGPDQASRALATQALHLASSTPGNLGIQSPHARLNVESLDRTTFLSLLPGNQA